MERRCRGPVVRCKPLVLVPIDASTGQIGSCVEGEQEAAGGAPEPVVIVNPDFWHTFHQETEVECPHGGTSRAIGVVGIFAD